MSFVKVDKLLGENVSTVHRMKFRSNKGGINTFASNRKKFCEHLRSNGYETFAIGNYVTATNGKETNTFFFASHNKNCKNYLIPVNLKNRVQYFVFYNDGFEDVSYARVVAYNKVREFCKNITKAVQFTYNGDPKMQIPDSWANEQVLNTVVFN